MDLVSDSYKKELEKLHAPGDWGRTSERQWKEISDIVDEFDCNGFLDYGSGRGFLKNVLDREYPGKYNITCYDPGVVEFSENNTPHDFLVCVDVMEHVEPELVDNVLDDLQRCTLKAGFIQIAHFPEVRFLPDGRNLHLVQEPHTWWTPKIEQRFKILRSQPGKDRSNYVVEKL